MSPAPNRTFDLHELDRPFYKRVADRLERLVEREPVSYLHPSKRWEYPWALERADLHAGSRVLDVGCGASILPIHLAREGHDITAVDRELPEPRLDRLHGVGIDYVAADLLALPFDDQSFDLVFCISVIEHLRTDQRLDALRELRRVLERGRLLLLTTDYYRDADANLRYRGPGPAFDVDWNFFDANGIREDLLAARGFRLAGDLDLSVAWSQLEPRMVEFHGYPYTSVGLALRKEH